MTIVQIVRSPAGGIRKHVMDIIQHFVARGDRVILITDLSSGDETFKKQVNEDWFKDIKVINFSIHRSPHHSDLKNIWKLFKILKPIKPDIIHGHGAKGGMYARILGRRKKSVYSPHGGSLHANYGAFKNYLYQLVEKLLLSLTGQVIVESRYTDKQFKKLISEGFQRISINYNGIAFPKERPQQKPLKYRVAALGLLRELKGFDLLVLATEELRAEYPDLRVKISGAGEEYKNLQQLITKLHLEKVVELTGEVESPLQTYEWADVIVVPSRFESFGLVALEAMAQGVPVVVSYTGGLMELVEHGETGRIFTRDSSSDLVEVLRTTFQHWELTQKYAEKAFDVAKSKYTMEHMLLGLEKTYSLLAKR